MPSKTRGTLVLVLVLVLFSNWQFIFYSESTNLEKKAMGVGCVIHMV